MPTEGTAQKLAGLVKTTQNKVTLINQIHSLITDLSEVIPPTIQDIQRIYPAINKILLECYPESGKKIEQKDLVRMLSDMNLLEEITFTFPRMPNTNATSSDIINDELCKWVTENVNDTVIVNCISSEEDVGGVTISYKGRFINLSLDRIIKKKVYV
jgi:hypothetical protein